MKATRELENKYNKACEILFNELLPGETASAEFSGESSTFLRFTQAKIRQGGNVDDARLDMKYFRGKKTWNMSVSITGNPDADAEAIAGALSEARRIAPLLPDDSYQVLPVAAPSSREEFEGQFPALESLPSILFDPAKGMDYVGVHSQGAICRGAANSLGTKHWFATETFLTDYSAYLPNGKAVKAAYAGRTWNDAEYRKRVGSMRQRLEAMSRPEKELKPGKYRVFIAPDAFDEFMPFFSWNGLGEGEIRQGESAFLELREGRRSFSPKFSICQDFQLGVEPRFNELGQLAPERLALIEGGKLVNTLVSSRSAAEYGVVSNNAPENEGCRSLSIAAGDLPEDQALARLGTGLYLSNLHYLNWSDSKSARVTGMTRFACLWVEDGKIVSPIKDMRFDISLYQLLGEGLEAITKEKSVLVERLTYDRRLLGGSSIPGFLVKDFPFTL